jgi:hypothetical protein
MDFVVSEGGVSNLFKMSEIIETRAGISATTVYVNTAIAK